MQPISDRNSKLLIQYSSELKRVYKDAVVEKNWIVLEEFYKEENAILLSSTLTVAKDTAFHMAVYSRRKDPLQHLLNVAQTLPFTQDAYAIKNAFGNTALHLAAMVGNYEAVELLVNKSQGRLIQIINNAHETSLFKAAAYGSTEVVKYLAKQPGQMTSDCTRLKRIHRRRTKDSILHVAIQGQHFETALELLRLDKLLALEEDDRGMTSLQLLANIPSAFKSGYSMGLGTKIFYNCLPVSNDSNDDDDINDDDEDDDNNDVDNITDNNTTVSETQRSFQDVESGDVKGKENQWQVSKANILSYLRNFLFKVSPKTERVWKEKRKHQFALKLANKLIKKDFSWNQSISEDPSTSFSGMGQAGGVNEQNQQKEKAEASGEVKSQQSPGQSEKEKQPETPLLAATRNGIVEIVYAILSEFPQSVEHYSHMRQNILHVAISHRQKDIFDFVKQMEISMDRLVGGIDSKGYTILHSASDMEHYTGGTRPGPAYKLQDELKWFKRVEKLVPQHFTMHRCEKGMTAKQLFDQQHKNQHEDAQKWIKETSQSCSTVAVLVATVVFAAAYTVPGGSNERGLPNFLNSPSFLFFTIMDVLSLSGSLTAVVMFLSILTSPFEMHEFRESLPRKLTIGLTLLFLSVATTTLTFAATVLLIIRLASRRMTATLVYTAAFVPVGILAMTQFPLYVACVEFVFNISKFIKKTFIWKLACRVFQ